MHDTSHAHRLIALLERQLALVERLERLAAGQGSLIRSGESEALLALLAQRQAVMDEFLAGQDELGPLAEWMPRFDKPIRGRIGRLIESVTGRLTDVLRRDEDDRSLLAGRRDRAAETLRTVRSGHRAQKAYAGTRAVTNRFKDSKG